MSSASADAEESRKVGWLSRWRYYLGSISTILLRVRPTLRVLSAFIGLTRRPFTIELPGGCRFRVRNRMDIWIIKETCLDRDYERDFVPVENGWTVVDVGAGLGDFTVFVARRCPDSTIFAFEPLPESYDLLVANLVLNRLANVRTVPGALAGTSGTLHLSSQPGLAERSRTHTGPADGPTFPVPAIGLAQAFERFGIQQCDFLKMDCEGAEYDILFGAPEDALRRIRRIAMEYHEGVTPYGREDLVRLLERNGFVVETRPNPAHREIGFLFATLGDAVQRAT